MQTDPSETLPLSVVIGTHADRSNVERVVRHVAEQVRDVGGEIVVAASYAHELPEIPEVRWITVPGEHDLMKLRSAGVRAARGLVIALGEDHWVPRLGWCEAVLRSHEEHADADAVAGCLVNATPERAAANASFLTYATPYMAPMPSLPPDRPPPISVLSVKRRALDTLGEPPDTLEARLLPKMFDEGRIAADDRIVADHYQDFNFLEAMKNQFWVNRSSYGYSLVDADSAKRRTVTRWIVSHVPQQFWREARPAVRPGPHGWHELAFIAVFSVAAAVGGVVGALFGPGAAPERMA